MSSSRLRFSGPALLVSWVLLSIVDGYLLAGFSNATIADVQAWLGPMSRPRRSSSEDVAKQAELDVARLPVNHEV